MKSAFDTREILVAAACALALGVMSGTAGCGAMSAGGEETVGGAEAGGFIGYQIVRNK
jgi:hypothetical protein